MTLGGAVEEIQDMATTLKYLTIHLDLELSGWHVSIIHHHRSRLNTGRLS
jgi:hypothetical protein